MRRSRPLLGTSLALLTLLLAVVVAPTAAATPQRPRLRAVAEQGSDHSSAQHPQATGAITGTVTDTAGKPVRGICVSDNQAPLVAKTNAAGRYRISDLASGSYQIGFVGGCGSKGSYAPQVYKDSPNLADTTSVRVRPGRVTAGIDAVLQPGGTVSGNVTDLAGSGLANACVALTPVDAGPVSTNLMQQMPFPTVAGSAIGFTSDNGYYRVGNLVPGQYYAQFYWCIEQNYATQWYRTVRGDPVPVLVGAGVQTRGVNAVMLRGGTITGNLKRKPRLASGCVAAVPIGGSRAFREFGSASVLAPQGRYRITGLPTGSYGVEFLSGCSTSSFGTVWYRHGYSLATATPVRVASGQTVAGIDETVSRGGSIRGRVTSKSGRPLAHICVAAANVRNPSATDIFNTDIFNTDIISTGITSADGSYRVGRLSSGRYNLEFATGCPDRGGVGGAVRLGVQVTAPRATTGVNVVLTASGAISGVVTGGPGGMAQPGVCVTAYPVTGPGLLTSALTRPNGSYSIGRLAPGGYRVRFYPCASGNAPVVPQWYGGGGGVTVTVASGRVSRDVVATLGADGSVSGTVTGVGGAAIGGICVTALPSRPPGQAAGTVPAVLAITGGSGSYQVAGLPPGRYLVRFSSGCGLVGYTGQWWQNASSARQATPVTVPADGAVTGIDARMQPS